MKGVPGACPNCGLIWGCFQGLEYGDGYVRLATRVWECSRCQHVVKRPDPSHRQIARR